MPSVLPTMLPLESRRLLAFDPAFAVPISGFGSQNVTDVAADADGNVYAVGTISGSRSGPSRSPVGRRRSRSTRPVTPSLPGSSATPRTSTRVKARHR